MSSTYPEAGIGTRAGVLRGTRLLGDPQVPGKKTCPANGRGPAKPRDAKARVTTSHRDGQSACPRNGADPDQKVGRGGGRGGRADSLGARGKRGRRGRPAGGEDADLLQV